MVLIRSVEVLDEFKVRLEFDTGEVKEVDLDPLLRGAIFEPLRQDPSLFRQVRVDHELGTIAWDNGADLDPDVLYGSHVPAWAEAEPASPS
jgi:hypothetical protein